MTAWNKLTSDLVAESMTIAASHHGATGRRRVNHRDLTFFCIAHSKIFIIFDTSRKFSIFAP